jgi:hypothetical protein
MFFLPVMSLSCGVSGQEGGERDGGREKRGH